ncbi:MAG: hypothetical protein ACKO5P_10075 [Nodosilinea sp.]
MSAPLPQGRVYSSFVALTQTLQPIQAQDYPHIEHMGLHRQHHAAPWSAAIGSKGVVGSE